MIINKEKLRKAVISVVAKRIEKQVVKERGLTEQDIQMFNRIFNQPLPEPVYQDHFALSPLWRARNNKTRR